MRGSDAARALGCICPPGAHRTENVRQLLVPKVGDRVRLDTWPIFIKGVTVTAVGRGSFLATGSSGIEMAYTLGELWRLAPEPPPVTVSDMLTELRAGKAWLDSILAAWTVQS